MSIKGYSTSKKLARLSQEFGTIEPIGLSQFGLTALSNAFQYQVGSDAVESGSATDSIVATAHAALRGDVIRFTSGTLSGIEVRVWSVTANLITLADDLSVAPSAADTFLILRHRFGKVGSDGELQVGISSIALPSGAATAAKQDTGNTSLSSIDGKLPALSGGRVPVDGSGVTQPVSAASLPLPSGAATSALQSTANTSLASVDGKLPALNSGRVPVYVDAITLPTGASTSALQSTGNTSLSSIDGKLPALSSGRVPVDGSGVTQPVSAASLPLPSGASTSALQSTGNTSLSSIDGKFGSLGQKAMTGSAPVVLASDQSALSTKNQDGSGNSLTSSLQGSNRGLHAQVLGKAVITTARNDYSSGSVTTGAWTQLVASTSGDTSELEIFDSSGQTLELGIGAAAAEARAILIFPGGNGRVPLRIASGTRVSIRAVSATASTGEIDINFYGA